MNILFFVSSDFSLATFQSCTESPHRIVLAITTPDQKKGRGLQLTPTPVRVACESRKIPVLTPASLKSASLIEQVKNLQPDIFVISSYGKMIPTDWLSIPRKAALNVHPSLLPKYRGAAPVNWAILNGDSETGVSIAEVTAKLDSGDVFYQEKFPIASGTNTEILTQRLAELSGKALTRVLQKMERGEALTKTPQHESESSYARKLTKADGIIDWARPAIQIKNLVQGLQPWPRATTHHQDMLLQILAAAVHDSPNTPNAVPGQVVSMTNDAILVQTGKGTLALHRVQPAGKKEMSAGEFARGYQITIGSRLAPR